ncbi:MAG: hypothetical protein AYK18_15140 [Theionarchaea archaeon DG-70]|nr:MAG: hypothetical protein AYK18_15140 [Theionarchaea archaeon DG-70]
MDKISERMLITIYGLGIKEEKRPSVDRIPPHCSSSGLKAIFSDIPKTTFYRKLNKLEKDKYILIKKKKRLSRYYEIINGQKIVIPSKYSQSREVKLTEKGKEIVSGLLISEFLTNIDVYFGKKRKRILFIDAVEYIRTHYQVEIHTALFHLWHHIWKRNLPIDLRDLGERITKER